MWRTLTEPTITITIHVAGDVADAKRSLAKQVMEVPRCFTVTPTTFVYTGGVEEGVSVGMVNYPRFPSDLESMWAVARAVAFKLILDLHQWSALIVGPDKSEWTTRKPEDGREEAAKVRTGNDG